MAHKWRAYTGLGLLLLMLAQSLLHPSAAAACQCGEPRAHGGEFLGTVTSVQEGAGQGSHRVIFQVLNAWSGVNTSYVLVLTGQCGPSFYEGVTYLVNVDRYDTMPGWHTDICSGISQIALTGKATHPYDLAYGDVISQKGRGMILRPISVDRALQASGSAGDDTTLLSLLAWGVLLTSIVLALGAAYRVYARRPMF